MSLSITTRLAHADTSDGVHQRPCGKWITEPDPRGISRPHLLIIKQASVEILGDGVLVDPDSDHDDFLSAVTDSFTPSGHKAGMIVRILRPFRLRHYRIPIAAGIQLALVSGHLPDRGHFAAPGQPEYPFGAKDILETLALQKVPESLGMKRTTGPVNE